MIVPMKKAHIACLRDDREALVSALFSVGEVMLIPQEESAEKSAEGAAKLREAETLLKQLKPYAPKKSFFDGKPEITEEKFRSVSEESERTGRELRTLLDDCAALEDGMTASRKAAEELKPWIGLSAYAEDICPTEYSERRLGFVAQSKTAALTEALGSVAQTEAFGNIGGRNAMLVVCSAEDAEETAATLREYEFEEYRLPFAKGSVQAEYDRLTSAAAESKAALEAKKEELTALSEKCGEISLLADQYRAERDMEQADMVVTDDAVYIEGWVRSDMTGKVTDALRAVTDCVAVEYTEPDENETPPTAAKNSKVISQFDTITNMFSVPSPREADPNPVMAPWYWLIFGMMMGDVGYGALMIIFTLIFKAVKKPKGSMAKLVNVLCYSGVTTMLCGALFGSYFGETWRPILFAPLEGQNILYMLLISCGIGVLHIFTGIIMKAVASFKAGDWQSALFDDISWILLLGGLCLLAINTTAGIVAAGVGAAVILVTAGRRSKSVFGKITGGLGSLYGITGYLSDILSYSRILALSISTGIIGMVMNILAKLVIGFPYGTGYLFAALICIVGHLFNLAMGMLSAFVHDSRLQYIEFFNRFYEGGGVEFKPFAVHTEQVDIVSDRAK